MFESTAHTYRGARNELFDSDEVQTILKRLTGCDLDKVFKKRLTEGLQEPTYILANQDELAEQDAKTLQNAQERLKMPPLRGVRTTIDVVLDEDEGLINFDDHGANYVFTDISDSVDDYSRAIIVREDATGVLREADWDVRDRINTLYWPPTGYEKMLEKPPLLNDENLDYILSNDRHEEILDLMYTQFEEDSSELTPVVERVYNDLAERKNFDLLTSTRYYGGMVFYLIANKRTSELVEYYNDNERADDVAEVVKLHALVHKEELSVGSKKVTKKQRKK